MPARNASKSLIASVVVTGRRCHTRSSWSPAKAGSVDGTLMGMVMVVVPEEAMAILEQVPDYHYIQQEDYENR